MNYNEKNFEYYFKYVFCVFTIVTSTIGCLTFIYINDFNSYTEHTCNITRVDYPTTMPEYGNHDNWVECNCGKRCVSLTPCINLYASIDPSLKIMNKYKDKEICTIWNKDCLDGEDPRWTNQILNSSIEKAEEYINSTVTCYYNKDITAIYLKKELNKLYLTLACFVLLLWFSCLVVVIFTTISKINKQIEEREKIKKSEDEDNPNIVHNMSYFPIYIENDYKSDTDSVDEYVSNSNINEEHKKYCIQYIKSVDN